MFLVYAISSEVQNYIYVGMTANLNDRLRRHFSGYEKTTKPYRPFRLIYQKAFLERSEARVFEKYLKSTSGKRFLKSLVT